VFYTEQALCRALYVLFTYILTTSEFLFLFSKSDLGLPEKHVLTIATGVTPLVFGRHDLSPLSIDDSREHLLRCCTRCAFKHRPYCR